MRMKKVSKILWLICLAIFIIPFSASAHQHHHEETPIPKAKPFIITGEKSTLQKLIDATEPGGTLLLENRTYRGSVTISKPITIQGVEGTKIASLETAITISNVKNVAIKDIDIEAQEVGIIGDGVESLQLKNIQIEQGTASIQLTNSTGIRLENIDITGQEGHFSTKGHAVAIYKSADVQAVDCDIMLVMDGFYIERVNDVTFRNNRIKEGRYAMHIMYSDNVVIDSNKVSSNMTGFMIMVGDKITLVNNEVSKNNTLNSLGVYMYDDDNVVFHQNTLRENTVAMSVENTRDMSVSKNIFSANGTVLQVKRSETLQITENEFYGNILTIRTDTNGAKLNHNYYDDYTGKDYDGDGIGDTNYIATNSFGQWMVRKPVYQYFIESPSVVTLNLMDTEVIDADSKIPVDESPLVLKKSTSPAISINGWQLAGSLIILILILIVRRKMK